MLLTAKEIKGKWHTTSYEPGDYEVSYSLSDIRDRILKAQLKQVVEILDAYKVDIGRVDKVPMVYLRILESEWQSLLKEVEDEGR